MLGKLDGEEGHNRKFHSDGDDRDLTDSTGNPMAWKQHFAAVPRGWKQVSWDSCRDVKKSRNKDTFYCNAATAVSPVAKKNPAATFINPIPTTMYNNTPTSISRNYQHFIFITSAKEDMFHLFLSICLFVC